MKTLLYLIALFSVVSSVAADPSAISGHVRQADGQPVAGAQVALFDVSDLAAGAVAQATTDDAGHFAFARKAWGGSGLPDGFGLGQNYPNPFNPSTIIPYHLPVATHVRLEVFNVLGQHVKTLVEGDRPAGAHTAVWDATDAAGQAVGAGVYIYRLSGGGATSTQKMVLVDGQAGRSAAVGGGWPAARLGGDETDATVYGLTVLGEGLVPYVDPAFRVEGGMGPVEVVLTAPVRAKRLQEEDRLLGDVDRNGRVDMVDALLVAAYVLNVSNTPVGDLDGDGVEDSARTVDLTDLGDVNGDELLTLHDAYLIGVYSINPSDPVLPAGIGERVASASGGTPNKMYWTSERKIQRANIDGSEVEDLITTGFYDPFDDAGIALDVGRGKMYWTNGRSKIQRANIDGSEVEDLITELRSPSGIALDVGRGKIYWTTSRSIQRANLDGSEVEDLITGSGYEGGIALGRGKIYWTTSRSIQRANLDGSEVEDLITESGYEGGIALDVGRGKIYWKDDSYPYKIQRANLDGSEVEDLITESGYEGGIALDVGRGKIYWKDDSYPYKIQRANLDGSEVEDLITGLDDPNGIALDGLAVSEGAGLDLIVGSPEVSDSLLALGQSFSLRARVRNRSPVRSAATTLRYYRSTDATISTSDTPVGTNEVGELSAWGTSLEAIDLTAPSNTGTYYYGACVESVSGESNTNNNCSDAVRVTVSSGGGGGGGTPNKMYWISGTKIQRANLDGSYIEDLITGGEWPRGLALDVGRGKIYWTISRSIQRANLNGSEVEDLITGGRRPNGIALDVELGKIYWKDTSYPYKIQRANLDGSEVEDLITGSGYEGGLALDVGRGKIYWTNGRGKIQRANLDGSEVEDLITGGLGDLGGLALDVGRGKMYWKNNSHPYKIQRANLDGSEVEDLITGSGYEGGLALDVGRGKIYWTTSRSIQRANLNGSEVEDLITTGLGALGGLALALDDLAVSEATGFDLVVESPSVSDSLLAFGRSFTLRVRVRNSSPVGAAATTLRYYRSTDATISTSDTSVGTDAVDELSARGMSRESITLTAPSNTGTYYYGACVESVSGESNTNNNCSTSIRVMVRAGSDLIVESPSVSDSLLTLGQSFSLSARVRNSGPTGSTATTLRYYRSTDARIDTSDTSVGTDEVGELSASGTSSESIRLRAPSSMGDYYYGACVEEATWESDSQNNCSDGVRVPVGLVIAPGARRQYTAKFSASISYQPSFETISYLVVSSNVDSGLLGVSSVDVGVTQRDDSFGVFRTITEVRFTYNLSVRSSTPLNTTLRARMTYEIVTAITGFPEAGVSVAATYTVPLIIFVRDSGSAKLTASDTESAMPVQEQGSLPPSSARINLKRFIEQPRNPAP